MNVFLFFIGLVLFFSKINDSFLKGSFLLLLFFVFVNVGLLFFFMKGWFLFFWF